MARMRAVECGVPVIRCANNGISFICDSQGQYLAQLGLGRRGFVLATLTPGQGRTPYVAYGAWPLFWFLIAWSLLAVVLAWRGDSGHGGTAS
jgi:apolipoprotein N-acyltransferase